jgi:hypothetical protein
MGFFSSPDPALTYQLQCIEAKLNLILEHLDIALPPDGMEDLRALIASGNKIGAIKLYRERTGVDLATAKAAIDAGL